MTTLFKYFFQDVKIKYRYEKIKDIIKTEYIRPDCQRYISEDRINEMGENIKIHLQAITPIYFCIFNKKRYVIDGQHRLKIYENLKKYDNIKIPIVDIYVNKKKEIYDYFLLINNQLVLNEIWRRDETIKDIVLKTYDYFVKKYPFTFRLPKAKIRPYIRPDNFMTQLTEIMDNEDIVKNYDIKSTDSLIYLLENLNKKYSEQDVTFYPGRLDTNRNLINKIKKNNALYFGMLKRSWMDNIINFTMPEQNKMSQALRYACWNKWIGKEKGISKCWCCNENEISQQYFEAGHIKAKILGGKNSVDNLRPICGFCNKAMGKQNMKRFMKDNNYNYNRIR